MRTAKHKRSNNKIKMIFMVAIMASVMAVIISSNLFIAKAGVKDPNSNNDSFISKKYYSSMTIKNDDTLWAISERYRDDSESNEQYINNIMEMNDMKNDTIYTGMHLTYYYYTQVESM